MRKVLKVLGLLVLCVCFLSACGDSERVKTAKYFDKSGEKMEAFRAWTNVLREEDNNDYAYERYINLALELNRSNLIIGLRDSSLERKAYFGQHKDKIKNILIDFFLKNIHQERIISDSLLFVLKNVPSFREKGLHFMIKEARKRAEEMPLTKINTSYIDDAVNVCKYFKHNADKEFAEIYFICGQRDDCNNPVLYLHKAVALDSQYSSYLAREMFKKAQDTRNDEERLYLLSEVVLMSDKAFPYSQTLLSEFKKLKARKSVKEMRVLVKKYGQSLSKKDREFLAPPLVWKEVFRKEYKGKGLTQKALIKIYVSGYMPGDKLIISSNYLEVQDVNNWVGFNKVFSVIPKYNIGKYPFHVRAPNKHVIIVKLMRKMLS